MIYPSVCESNRMFRFHQFAQISPSDGINTASWRQKSKPVFQVIPRLRRASTFLITDSESAHKSNDYREVFGMNADFNGEVGTKSWFRSKSCFCCSRKAASVPMIPSKAGRATYSPQEFPRTVYFDDASRGFLWPRLETRGCASINENCKTHRRI